MIKSKYTIIAVVTMATHERSENIACVAEFELYEVSVSADCTICLQKLVVNLMTLNHSLVVFWIELLVGFRGTSQEVLRYDSRVFGSGLEQEEIGH